MLARLGGDEFAVIQIDYSDQIDAAICCSNRIIKMLSEPLVID
ncbi:hypothetical protein ABTM58_20795, partial [Acinetobacter baumannii]